MFRKIVSQLSLSPSAASQLTFYARRLGQERVTRKFSAIGAILIMGLQFAVILAPPTASNAASSNDLILGGIVSKADLLNRYDQSSELQALYNRMGISRADIEATTTATINSKDHSLLSMGRNQHGTTDNEIDVGSHVYWLRGLYVWDTGANIQKGSSYQVLQGHRSTDGGYFAVMFHCGNIVVKTLYTAPKPTPKPPTPIPTPIPTPTPKTPTVSCTYLIASLSEGQPPLKVTFTGKGSATGQTISQYAFDFGDKTSSLQSTDTAVHTYQTAGTYTATLKVKGSAGKVSDTPSTCLVTMKVTPPPAAFTKAKTAVNLTQNIDATTKPANGGDLITYHLTTKNTGGVASSYVVVEHVEDVLEYADVTDATGATLANGALTWPAATIKPGAVLSTTFTVKIKNPVPSTPVGLSDPNSFDLRLDNIYGDAIQISVAPSFGKQVEAAATNLPATGPSAGTIIVLGVCAISLFFYFRNRQLMTEIRLLRGEFQGGI